MVCGVFGGVGGVLVGCWWGVGVVGVFVEGFVCVVGMGVEWESFLDVFVCVWMCLNVFVVNVFCV